MNTSPAWHKRTDDVQKNDYVKDIKNCKDLTATKHGNETESRQEKELNYINKPSTHVYDNELQLYPMELRPLMDNKFMKNFGGNRKRNCCMHQHDKDKSSNLPCCKERCK